MKNQSKITLTIITLIVAVVVVFLSQPKSSDNPDQVVPTPSPTPAQNAYNYTTPLTISDQEIMIEIAKSPQEITKGLSGRPNLAEGKGMLFIFDPPQPVNFWMPDMHFPLDIIFIRENKIVHIAKDVPNPPLDTPKSELPTYSPGQAIDKVLEVPAGWSEKNGIRVGNEIKLSE